MGDARKPVFDLVREIRGKGFSAAEVSVLDGALDVLEVPKVLAPSEDISQAPPWLKVAYDLIGMKEIPGPRHNKWIVNGWKRLGAGWFTDDETPWCGLFTAHCIDAAGIKYPKMFPRAKSWANWGLPASSLYGAVAVFERRGGGHVGFLVGQAPGKVYILGGNQRNEVNIMPLERRRLIQLRWPEGHRMGIQAPQRTGGVVSTNEA